MWARLERLWRMLATGLGFMLFGIGGLLLRVLIFPLLQLAPGHCRMHACKAALRYSFVGLIHLLRLLGVLSFDLKNRQLLERQGLLIISNHPSLLDVVFLIAWVKNVDCVIKASLWHNPCMKGPIQTCRFILNQGGEQLIERCRQSLAAGNNLILFPEGTRSVPGKPLQFQRGVAHLCLRTPSQNLTPILIRVEPPMLVKGEPWYRVPPVKPHFRFDVLPDLDLQAESLQSLEPSLASRQLTQTLQHFFSGELTRHG